MKPVALLLAMLPALAHAALPAPTRAAIEDDARALLARTGIPGASVAVARDGEIVLATAVGNARVDPPLPADPSMAFPIGSVSKQFTAAAVLLLAEDRRLRLDDPAGRHLKGLGPAASVTIREALAHTGGLRDYWPQDYVFPAMLRPVTARGILDQWAARPTDFPAGTSWQYSNTGYVLAGAIAEKAARQPLFAFLRARVFEPLGMRGVVDVDQGRLGPDGPTGYQRRGLGPARVAPKEGPGWLFAAGGLAMPASDLARWDIALMAGTVLKPASMRALTTESVLRDGTGTHYALGLDVKRSGGRRTWEHGGEVSGFCAHNLMYPEQRLAVVAFVNQDNNGAAQELASRVAKRLLADASPETARAADEARAILEGLRAGRIDRARFTANGNAYFSDDTLADFRAGLSGLGALKSFSPGASGLRGGMSWRVYTARFETRSATVLVRALPDGTIEQFTVSAE